MASFLIHLISSADSGRFSSPSPSEIDNCGDLWGVLLGEKNCGPLTVVPVGDEGGGGA